MGRLPISSCMQISKTWAHRTKHINLTKSNSQGIISWLAYLFLILFTIRVPVSLRMRARWWIVESSLSNSICRSVFSLGSSMIPSLLYWSRRSLAGTSVTPHSMASRIASWRKMYWSCVKLRRSDSWRSDSWHYVKVSVNITSVCTM